MIDSHCHLTYEPLSVQLEAVLARAAAGGVDRMITIGTTLPDARLAIQLSQTHPQIRCSIGIHPHYAGETKSEDLAALRELEREPGVLALGEIGLDYHYDFAPRPQQREVFVAQLELAKETGRPIVIHCREGIDDCLVILKDYSQVPAVFHCFTGTIEEARRILDRGYLLGFTGVVTFKKSGELREIVRFVPADRMLLETDSPYLAPEPFRSQKVNEPAMVVHTAAAIAKIRGVDLKELDRVTSENTRRFFRWA
jgi:TatD DNase family protein